MPSRSMSGASEGITETKPPEWPTRLPTNSSTIPGNAHSSKTTGTSSSSSESASPFSPSPSPTKAKAWMFSVTWSPFCAVRPFSATPEKSRTPRLWLSSMDARKASVSVRITLGIWSFRLSPTRSSLNVTRGLTSYSTEICQGSPARNESIWASPSPTNRGIPTIAVLLLLATLFSVWSRVDDRRAPAASTRPTVTFMQLYSSAGFMGRPLISSGSSDSISVPRMAFTLTTSSTSHLSQ
mmetsp:Transcript_31607/g.62506  ORF Transcript_31607/g.62506 Transcript_31607/m.62506 type:complete len:239 (-) Transcript_31607:145-861(-)